MAVQNGKVPTTALTQIPAEFYTHDDDTYLTREAAASFLRLAAAFRARFGKRLVGVSFYRPYARQVEIFTKNYRPVNRKRSKRSDRTFRGQTWEKYRGANVASPGYSNHGLGLAVDIHSGVQTIGSPEHDWMLTAGDDYGWNWDEGKRNGEGWHFRYVAAQDRYRNNPAGAAVAAAAQTATKVAEEVDDMFNDADRGALKALYDTQKRHTQQIDAIEKTLNAADGRGKQAFDRVLGFLVQRRDAKGNPARALDTLDGDTLRNDIRTAKK